MTKTTENYAEKRGIVVDVLENYEYQKGLFADLVGINRDDYDYCEVEAQYIANEDGTFTFFNQHNKNLEDMPATIRDEKHLREVVAYVAEVLYK